MARKVLVVDDDPDEIELLKEAFSEVAPAVTCDGAPNGLAALDYLSAPGQALPDIILLDINMPVMNGWDFLRNVRGSDRLKSIPVVVYTTTDREQDKLLADSLGALKFIRKPENYGALKRELETLLRSMKSMPSKVAVIGAWLEDLYDAVMTGSFRYWPRPAAK